MKYFLYLLFIIFYFYILCMLKAYSFICESHPIYCHIIKISPKINKSLAFRISNKIYKYSKKYGVDSRILTAILRQESNFNLQAKGCHFGIDENFEEKTVCSDFGMSQIYIKTAKRYGFDIKRLTEDVGYSIECGAIVLKDIKKRYGEKENNYWSRYNALSKTKRELYEKLVGRYL
jgi:soluble lytic murein transglycosylase-like protein